jgi:hypothetical protein
MDLDALDWKASVSFPGYIVRKDLVRQFKGQYPVPGMTASWPHSWFPMSSRRENRIHVHLAADGSLITQGHTYVGR